MCGERHSNLCLLGDTGGTKINRAFRRHSLYLVAHGATLRTTLLKVILVPTRISSKERRSLAAAASTVALTSGAFQRCVNGLKTRRHCEMAAVNVQHRVPYGRIGDKLPYREMLLPMAVNA